jgi:hypothetical protein
MFLLILYSFCLLGCKRRKICTFGSELAYAPELYLLRQSSRADWEFSVSVDIRGCKNKSFCSVIVVFYTFNSVE